MRRSVEVRCIGVLLALVALVCGSACRSKQPEREQPENAPAATGQPPLPQSDAEPTQQIPPTAPRGGQPNAAAPLTDVGTITGQVRWTGKAPGNTVIRMGVDPMCSRINAGKRRIQEAALVDADGGLANIFVSLQGTFPPLPMPTEAVTIDQRGCIYVPRVVGAQVGQTVRVHNSDQLLHNVRTVSRSGNNDFNIGQPVADMVYDYTLKDEEGMLQLKCDLHRWMTAYIGVVSHPHFAVTGTDGTFEIANVPVGTYDIQTWHERYGTLTQPVRVRAGATTAVSVVYTGSAKAPLAAVQDLTIPVVF